MVNSGFAEDLQDKLVEDGGDYAVRAHATKSMKNLPPLTVNLVLSNASGYVMHASCYCKASLLGRCAHIAAVLLELCEISTAEENTIVPSTSKPCTWNKGKNMQETHKNSPCRVCIKQEKAPIRTL